MHVQSSATATWTDGLKSGKGEYRAASGAFQGQYSFKTRFEGEAGTTPEELIAAALAGCFSMALAANLEKGGNSPKRIETTATSHLKRVNDKPTVTTVQLKTRGVVPGINAEAFAKAAAEAKAGCPVSRALNPSIEIELSATLES